MDKLNLPDFELKICEQNGKPCIFDPIRKKWVAATPEEFVRQHFVNYLVTCKSYPLSHIANETAITVGNVNKRCDSVVYDKCGKPKIILEYKAPSVKIDNKVFAQISRYNISLKVDYLIVSNGMNHYCLKVDYNTGRCTFLPDIPDYNSIQR
ncbi:MAG: type I restriction enzyme HsdR N-terminal domain-containing protein [Bacteroidaceae bacterium]|nr:type I restriction enzyme HsdR N-terminal domain-containing protein [Bacteroidaceae bacterium]